jgi:tetratricopeptide (TPR) repeat protein
MFIVMALVDGANLRRWLSTERSVAEILRQLTAAGRGLAAAHAAGLIHRDLKPDNIFVADGGDALVGDFGLAAEHGEASGGGVAAGLIAPDLTVTGMVLGTPAYMAPEQALGEATAASDQFSFCVTAWEALYRARPFGGETIDQVMAAIRDGRITPPVRERGVPISVRRALVRGLSADPAARFASMDELLAALAPRPRRWPWLLAGGVVLVGGGVLAVAVTRDEPAASPPSAAVPMVDAAPARELEALAALLVDAQAALDRFDVTAADTAAREALTLADRLRDDHARAHAGALLAEALIRLGRGVEAEGQLAQAEAALDRAGGAWEIALALAHARAVQADAAGDRAARVIALQSIVDELRRRGIDDVRLLRAGVELADALQMSGRVADADAAFASVAHLYGDDRVAALERVLFESEQAQTVGDLERAIDTARQTVVLTRALGRPVIEQASASWGLGASCELAGDWACARDAYRTTTELLRVMPDASPGDLVDGLEGVARNEIELGHAADAVVWVREALDRARDLDDANRVQTASLVLGRALLLTGHPDEVRTLLEPVLREIDAEAEPSATRRAGAAFSLAQALWDTGGEPERARARVLADDAIRDYELTRVKYEGNPAFVSIRRMLVERRATAVAWRERHP